MFRHLLVPLDGSPMAESSLPAAAYLAGKMDVPVTLIHAIEEAAPATVHGRRHLARPDEARVYLDEIARRAFPAGVRVECHVHANEIRDVARSIGEHAETPASVLVVMCTHGRSGLRRLVVGNIAQQVVALGAAPVLLIPPATESGATPFVCRRILVPLDGAEVHEQGLPAATALARACGAAIHLIRVVPTRRTLSGDQAATGLMLPRTTHAVLELAEEEAAAYLRRQVACHQAAGVQVFAQVLRGDPAKAVVSAARRLNADLIVLSTHRRAGTQAFWSRSVAPKVVALAQLPALLVPIVEP